MALRPAPVPKPTDGVPPHLDDTAVEEVRKTLARVGYEETAVRARLGAIEAGIAHEEHLALWLWRTRELDPLSVLIRLFLLEQPVSRAAARHALAPSTIEAWQRMGLLALTDRTAQATVHLSLHPGLVIAADRAPVRGEAATDQVLGPTTATLLLERLMIRGQGERALDLGTGAGHLALRLAAGHREVIGTDTNPRAIAYARLNARLNGLANLTFQQADRFGKTEGRFDLAIGNLPFVVSPERRWSYRDAGQEGDAFFAGVVRGAGAVLQEGGFAQLFGQWVHLEDEDEDARIATWLERTGCDAFILRFDSEPVERHALRWVSGPGRLDPRERAARYERWMSWFRGARVHAVSTGVFILRRRSHARNWLWIEDSAAPARACGDDVMRRFADFDLVESASDERLLALRFVRNPSLVRHAEMDARGSGWGEAGGRLALASGLGEPEVGPVRAWDWLDLLRPEDNLATVWRKWSSSHGRAGRAAFLEEARRLVRGGFIVAVDRR
jgi:SAM-dependent methyltransferase